MPWFLHVFFKYIIIFFHRSLWLLWIKPWYKNKSTFFLMMSGTMYLLTLKIMKSLFDFFWHNFYSKNSDSISFHLLSALFIFSQAPRQEIWQVPQYKMKKKPNSSIFFVIVFSYGWERGQHKVNAPLKHFWNPALRIYIMHCPCQGSL